MFDLLITVPLGVVLMLTLFPLLRRFAGLDSKLAAAAVALIGLAAYTPFAVIRDAGADVVALHFAVYLVTAYILGVLGNYREKAAQGAKMRIHWGPLAIAGFFGVVLLSDTILVIVSREGMPNWLAQAIAPPTRAEQNVRSVFPGVVSHDYQQKESQYNEYLAQIAAQKKRGWQLQKGWLGEAVAGSPAVFQLVVTDRDGVPVRGAKVSGEFMRPSDSRMDQAFSMDEVEPGVYQVRITLQEPGLWDLVMHVRRGDDLHEVRASTTLAMP